MNATTISTKTAALAPVLNRMLAAGTARQTDS